MHAHSFMCSREALFAPCVLLVLFSPNQQITIWPTDEVIMMKPTCMMYNVHVIAIKIASNV